METNNSREESDSGIWESMGANCDIFQVESSFIGQNYGVGGLTLISISTLYIHYVGVQLSVQLP